MSSISLNSLNGDVGRWRVWLSVRNEQSRFDSAFGVAWRAWARTIETKKIRIDIVSKTTKSQCLFKLLTKVNSPLVHSFYLYFNALSIECSITRYNASISSFALAFDTMNTNTHQKYTIAVNYLL